VRKQPELVIEADAKLTDLLTTLTDCAKTRSLSDFEQ
jgi:hypothetical protein